MESKRKPNPVERAVSFTQAQITDAGRSLLTQEQIDARLGICAGGDGRPPCPLYTGSMCASCLCFVNRKRSRLNKLALPSMVCPEGEWDAIQQ